MIENLRVFYSNIFITFCRKIYRSIKIRRNKNCFTHSCLFDVSLYVKINLFAKVQRIVHENEFKQLSLASDVYFTEHMRER